MKVFISFLMTVSFVSISALGAGPAKTKRKVAQAKLSCVPLGTALQISDEDGYTLDELRMLRNSIYAQFGFKFKSEAVAAEMVKRGCQKTDVTFSDDKVQGVDKQNVRVLKAWEQSMKDDDQMTNFQASWDKAASSPRSRAKLLASNYCFLTTAQDKYIGILFFGSSKSALGTYELNGMMNLEKPTWAEPMTDQERADYLNNISYKTLDTTSAVVLDYSTKGTWVINDTKKALGQLQVAITADGKAYKNVFAAVTSAKYKNSRMLDCKLAE